MNNPRRNFLTLGVLGAVTIMVGCSTPAIDASHHYTENVSSILMSQDKQKIVFIGKKYHYIFDAPAGVAATLERPFHSKVSGDLSSFHVDDKDSVTGLFSLRVEGALSEQDKIDATTAGYKPDETGSLVLSGKITGIRYQKDTSLLGKINEMRNPQANLEDKAAMAESLNKTYTITITYDPSNGEKAADTMISPIIVTSDGLYLLFNLFLAPVLIPIAISKVSPDCFPYCIAPNK